MRDIGYSTTRSKKATSGLVRNGLITGLAAAFFSWLWLTGGGALYGLGAVGFALISLFILFVLMRSATPLQITQSDVIISSGFRSSFPLAKVQKIGEHPTRKTPSLTFADPEKGHSGEITLPWKFIAEPQEEVLAKLQAAIDANQS